MLRIQVLAALLAASLAACSPAQPSGPQGVTFDRDGVRFTAPAGWRVEASGAATSGGGHWLVYLATQAIHDNCRLEGSEQCLPPLETLSPGGALIAWHSRNCAGPDCTLPDGQPTRVGGREAAVVAAQDACGGIGETEETQYLVAVSPQRIDTIVICGRGLSDATREAIRVFLENVVWRTP